MIFQIPANSAYWQTTIDLTKQFGYDVDVTATIDERTGIATWIFTTIDPATGAIPLDPTVGFLPPDDANGIGEGFVSYTVMATQSDPTGTVIYALATVTFDTEPPLNTPQIFNTIDGGAGLSSSVVSLPAYESSAKFNVAWSGADADKGSAVSSYTIYVSDNGGPYTAWLTNTALTAAPFLGQDGHIYNFYSIAADNAGNLKPTPTGIQSSTMVDTTPPTSGVSPLPSSEPFTSFSVTWSGQDNAGGSGIGSYDLYVSDNGGIFTHWLTGTTQTSATFMGINGHSYTFYSLAVNKAGNIQATTMQATTTTQINAPVLSSTTSLKSTENPSKLGDSITFTAIVSPAQSTNGTPTGTVQFQIDGVNYASPVTLINGAATLAVAKLAIGDHTVTATYTSDNGLFDPSTAVLPGAETINRADVVVQLASGAEESRYGQSLIFTATISAMTPGLPPLTGTVQFKIDNAPFGAPINLVDGQVVSSTIATLSVGDHTVTALYSGDPDFTSNTGSVLQTVAKAHLTVTANAESMTYGGAVPTLTYSITGFVNGDTSSVVSGAAPTHHDGHVRQRRWKIRDRDRPGVPRCHQLRFHNARRRYVDRDYATGSIREPVGDDDRRPVGDQQGAPANPDRRQLQRRPQRQRGSRDRNLPSGHRRQEGLLHRQDCQDHQAQVGRL